MNLSNSGLSLGTEIVLQNEVESEFTDSSVFGNAWVTALATLVILYPFTNIQIHANSDESISRVPLKASGYIKRP